MKQTITATITCLIFSAINNNVQSQPAHNDAAYRPLIHFTPATNWMNDPNGMVYYNGVYHLFYQHYPNKPVWGPMHWGHATSNDMIHWKREPIALFPDSLGYIFSGSAVVDNNNTSGFGKNGKVALVAIFTHHDPKGEKTRNDFQNQSLAYSLDNGKTWIKYAHNPVLKNPGITDFRDPKVMWYEQQKKWIMTLAVKDRIAFYSSPDLKNWKKESEFGASIGAHGGVWECPDLFTLNDNNKKRWVLIVNLNPGGPNKGSATQYFVGDFDGTKFTPLDTKTRWLDYGPDEYAGVTWSNTGDRKIFLGWMSNWLYADKVPTETWRSAMTIPRELKLKHDGNEILVASQPAKELSTISEKPLVVNHLELSKDLDVSQKTGKINIPCRIQLDIEEIKDFSVVLSNNVGEQVIIGYDDKGEHFFIDRTRSGKTDFNKNFGERSVAPRFTRNKKCDVTLVIDVTSVELFADDGLTVMTEIFFPNQPFNQFHITSGGGDMLIDRLEYIPLRSVWK